MSIHVAILALMPAKCRNDVAPSTIHDLPHASIHTSRVDGNLIEKHEKFFKRDVKNQSEKLHQEFKAQHSTGDSFYVPPPPSIMLRAKSS